MYQDDGSRKQGTGGYSVQGINIDGRFRPLQTLKIASETRENLADLKVTVFNLLQACSGIEAKRLFEKLDFYMSDSTSHNFLVMDMVAEKLETNSIPSQLVCNMHPVLCFTRVLASTWRDVELSIGREKLFANVLGAGGISNTSYPCVTVQALDCLMRIISRDFNEKSWCLYDDFTHFIAPAKNFALRLRQERFESLGLTCAVAVHHAEKATSFLQEHSSTNQLACLNRQFLALDFLPVMYCTGVLLGIHVVQPYVAFVFQKPTYSELTDAMRRLDNGLGSVDPAAFLDVESPALDFVSEQFFAARRYPHDLCQSIALFASAHHNDIVKFIRLLLPRIRAAFQKQRGEWFGFGGTDPENSRLSQYDKDKLENAPVHNIASEQLVGLVNYELCLRGNNHLAAVSRSIITGKNSDLLDSSHSKKFREFACVAKSGGSIPKILGSFAEKQAALEKTALLAKQGATHNVERRRHLDLAFLEELGGPFVNACDVDTYIADQNISVRDKEKRLYREVRFARDLSLSIPRSSDIFRLKEKYRNLPIESYASQLKIYLRNVTATALVTMEDFSHALEELSS